MRRAGSDHHIGQTRRFAACLTQTNVLNPKVH